MTAPEHGVLDKVTPRDPFHFSHFCDPGTGLGILKPVLLHVANFSSDVSALQKVYLHGLMCRFIMADLLEGYYLLCCRI